jgi:hypothetical protein
VKPEEAFSTHSKLKRNTCPTAAPCSPNSTARTTGASCLAPSDSSSSADSAPDSSWSLVADWDEVVSSPTTVLSNFEVSQLSSLYVNADFA